MKAAAVSHTYCIRQVGKVPQVPVFDAHFHIVDPRFALTANRGFVPEPFTVTDYRARVARLGVSGGAVVAGSFQGDDQTWLRAALRELGAGFVGVAQVPSRISDAEVRSLAAAGVVAHRVNLFRGGRPEDLALAPRLAALAGWHTEVYLDAADLPALEPRLRAVPRLVVDHLGLTRAGLPHLLELVERGARVKATGFSRTDLDVPAALEAIAAVDPGAIVFGTDLPSTRAPEPFKDADAELVRAICGERAMYENAHALYGASSANRLRLGDT
jgi:predicted TIM-barrel fold metal-dependent hydrolase